MAYVYERVFKKRRGGGEGLTMKERKRVRGGERERWQERIERERDGVGEKESMAYRCV